MENKLIAFFSRAEKIIMAAVCAAWKLETPRFLRRH